MKKYLSIFAVFALVLGFSFMSAPKAEAVVNWNVNFGLYGGNNGYGYDPYGYGGYGGGVNVNIGNGGFYGNQGFGYDPYGYGFYDQYSYYDSYGYGNYGFPSYGYSTSMRTSNYGCGGFPC